MKTALMVSFMMISTIIFSQNLDKFLGFRFGTTRDSVKKVMLTKPGCKLDLEASNEESLLFTNVKFAGRDAEFIAFKFVNNKFHTGIVLIFPKLESQIVDLYNDIKKELDEKYYETFEVFEIYDYPYEKGDGHTETAIKLGKAKFNSYWSFKNLKSESENDKNVISLSIVADMYIKIAYQDGLLISEAIEKKKNKDYQDY